MCVHLRVSHIYDRRYQILSEAVFKKCFLRSAPLVEARRATVPLSASKRSKASRISFFWSSVSSLLLRLSRFALSKFFNSGLNDKAIIAGPSSWYRVFFYIMCKKVRKYTDVSFFFFLFSDKLRENSVEPRQVFFLIWFHWKINRKTKIASANYSIIHTTSANHNNRGFQVVFSQCVRMKLAPTLSYIDKRDKYWR